MPASTAVVKTGRAIITNRLKGSGTTPLYIGVGTGSTAVSLDDTTLVTEVDSRVTGTASQTTTAGGSTNNQYTVTGTFTCGATSRTITECGLFDASTAGNLFLRAVLGTSAALTNGDTVTFTFNVEVTSSVV